MKRGATILIALLLLGSPAGAVFNADDPVPAATLLLPWFRVERFDPNGMQTTFTVRNAGPAEALAHVTLWTTEGGAFLTFDVFLSPFDVQEVRLIDAIEDELPFNTICLGKARSAPLLPRGFGPIVEGFVTIDSVSECSTLRPDDKGYFVAGGLGIANNENVLWGDYQILHRAEGIAVGERLVSIEALPALPLLVPRGTGGSTTTFYSTFAGSAGADQRERLSPRWGGRYDVRRGARTDVIFWRNFLPQVCLLPCAEPRGLPTPQVRILAFDENENVSDLTNLDPFDSIANRVTLDSEQLPIPFDTGWLFLDASGSSGGVIVAEPRGIPIEGQAHMTVLRWRQDGDAATAARGVNLQGVLPPDVD